MVLTDHRVNYGTLNVDGNPSVSTMFSPFPFKIIRAVSSAFPDGPFAAGLAGPYSIQKLAEIYYRTRVVRASFSGFASITDWLPSGASGTPLINVSISAGGWDMTRSGVSVPFDLISSFKEWNDSQGNSDVQNEEFTCEATEPPSPQAYGGDVSEGVTFQFTSPFYFITDHASAPASYFATCSIIAGIGARYLTGGPCGDEGITSPIGIDVSGPVDPDTPVDSGLGESILFVSVFGASVPCLRIEGDPVAAGVPEISFDGLGSLTFTSKEFWPYANSVGSAVYDTATGTPLVDPRS